MEEVRFIKEQAIHWKCIYGIPEKRQEHTLLNAYIIDISALRDSQTKSKENEAFFHRVIDSAQVAILHIDKSGKILFGNRHARDLLRLGEGGKRNIYDYLHPEDISSFINNIKNREWGDYVPLEARIFLRQQFLFMGKHKIFLV